MVRSALNKTSDLTGVKFSSCANVNCETLVLVLLMLVVEDR